MSGELITKLHVGLIKWFSFDEERRTGAGTGHRRVQLIAEVSRQDAQRNGHYFIF